MDSPAVAFSIYQEKYVTVMMSGHLVWELAKVQLGYIS